VQEKNKKFRILHVLPQSLPSEFGSSIRSKYVVEKQKSFSSPFVAVYPTFSFKQIRLGNPAEINGVKYFYFIDRSLLRKKLYDFRLSRPLITMLHTKIFGTFLKDLAFEIKPNIIHAASPYTVGIPSLHLARALNVPFIYEVRNLSEFDVLTGRNFVKGGLRFEYRKRLENYLILKADAVITISECSRKEIISRGVSQHKVFCVLNGIDPSFFRPMQKDKSLLKKLELKNKFVIGFIGKLKRIEGLELMIKALLSLLKKNRTLIFLIVGDGPEKDVLRKLANRMDLENQILFLGKISFSDIRKFYSIIDLFVVPRIKTKLADLIGPLKPLEAMAMKIPVLGSDVSGIKELIKNEENGYIFKAGSVQDLSEKITKIMENKEKMKIVKENAFNWVIENRNWNRLIYKYDGIYKKVISKKSFSN